MCGIAGFVDFDGHVRSEAAAVLRRMTDVLVHRGPDGEGLFVDDHAALGHRRLSIIDVARGHQPMGAAGQAVQIVFNGEIYNYRALRDELEAAGHRFATCSDTEVILQGYLAWGERCVERLNGMFAFAIWDSRNRRLFLARDRVGKKPLYYWRDGARIAFASELKALRALGLPQGGEIDEQALDCYFVYGYIPAPRTIHRGVHKLRAAHTMFVDDAGERSIRYWTLRWGNGETRSTDPESVVDELESLLDEAVRCRLMSEVPLGAFLSGGLDSSLVVSAMSRLSGKPVSTHSIGFDEAGFSELPTARATAGLLDCEHHEYTVRPDAVDVLPRIAHHFDEPLADSSAVPTWYVCEMARRSVTVALSGDGGDEAFAGYTFRYVPHEMESRVRRRVPAAIRAPLFGALGHVWPASARLPRFLRLKTVFENLAVSDVEAFHRDLAWLREDTRRGLYSRDFLRRLQGFTPRETVYPHYLGNEASDALGRAQYADMHFYLPEDVLVKADRMSMAHSLEVRSPLLDYRILEYAARLPSSMKMNTRNGKLPLRALARRRLPESLLALPKRGFSIPAAQWLRAELAPMVEDLLFGTAHASLDALDRRQLRILWQEHRSGGRDHSVFLWAALMLALWEDALHAAPIRRAVAA